MLAVPMSGAELRGCENERAHQSAAKRATVPYAMAETCVVYKGIIMLGQENAW
jgi:hypothetical protein